MDPQTPEQWKEAVTAAYAMVLLSDARDFYGLVSGGPPVNRERCIEILERGSELGYEPDEDEAQAFLASYNLEAHALRRANVTRRIAGLSPISDAEVAVPLVVDLSDENRKRAERLSEFWERRRADDDSVE